MPRGIPNTTPAAKFRRLYQNPDIRIADIAAECGYSDPRTVTKRAKAMGLPLRVWKPGRPRKVDPETACVLVCLGLTHREIAIQHRCTQQAVSHALRKVA